MAIQTEIWLSDLQENLFPSNAFYQNAIDDTPNVIEGKTVHIPQAGSKPNVVKNRTSLPATISQRTDSELTYELDSYSTNPILVQNTEEVELSYQKRQNVLMEHQDMINSDVAADTAYAWAPTKGDNIVRTSDSDTRDATAPSATGTRKRVSRSDIVKVREVLDRMDVPTDDNMLFAVVPPEYQADLMLINDFVHADKIGSAQLVSGTIGQLLGINIFVRSKAAFYDSSSTPQRKQPDWGGAAGANLGGIFWSRSMVRKAKGSVQVYAEEDKPEYYGDVMSAEVRAGGSKSRSDEKGIVALVQQS